MLEQIALLLSQLITEAVPLIQHAIKARAEEHQAIVDRLTAALSALRGSELQKTLAADDAEADALLGTKAP